MANGIITGPPQVDFYKMLGGLGDTLSENQKRALQREAFSADPISGTVDFNKALTTFVRAGDLDSAAKVSAMQKALSPESTPDIQNFKYADKNPAFLPFLKQQAEAKSTKINNAPTFNNVGDKAYDTALNKDLAEAFLGYQKAGRNAAGAINTLNYMENLTKNPNFYSGAGGDMVTKAKQALTSMGISTPDSASSNEVFKALSNKLTLDAAGGSLGAQISNSDVSFLQAINPNLASSPEGNRELIGYHRKVYQRQQDVARMARDYAKSHGGRIDAGFDQVVADFAEKNPLFPEGGTSPQQAAPQRRSQVAPQDIDASLSNARAAIARNPASRGAVIQRLRENGIDPGGL